MRHHAASGSFESCLMPELVTVMVVVVVVVVMKVIDTIIWFRV